MSECEGHEYDLTEADAGRLRDQVRRAGAASAYAPAMTPEQITEAIDLGWAILEAAADRGCSPEELAAVTSVSVAAVDVVRMRAAREPAVSAEALERAMDDCDAAARALGDLVIAIDVDQLPVQLREAAQEYADRAMLESLAFEGHHRPDICPRCGERYDRHTGGMRGGPGEWACYYDGFLPLDDFALEVSL